MKNDYFIHYFNFNAAHCTFPFCPFKNRIKEMILFRDKFFFSKKGLRLMMDAAAYYEGCGLKTPFSKKLMRKLKRRCESKGGPKAYWKAIMREQYEKQ